MRAGVAVTANREFWREFWHPWLHPRCLWAEIVRVTSWARVFPLTFASMIETWICLRRQDVTR